MGFKNVEDVVVLKGWDKDRKAYIGENSKGNTFYARKSPKLKDLKMKYGVKATAKLGKKEGEEVWYINAIDLPKETMTTTEVKAQGAVASPKYDSAGQDRGNFRNNITDVIIAAINKDIKGEALDAVVLRYIEVLKVAEAKYFEVEKVDLDSDVDLPDTDIPEEAPADEF